MSKKFLLFFICLLSSYLFGQEVILVGIAGGTASGKTTIAEKIHEVFPQTSLIISQDNYYKDLTHLSKEEQKKVNFDHPNSIDFDLLKKHLLLLKAGDAINEPIYDFCTHGRKQTTIELEPKRIIIVEGILVLAVPEIRNIFDVKIFVDTDDDIRLLRRIERDIKYRNRTFESVRDQYLATVQPMHNEFVEPSKRYADFIIPRGGENTVALSMILSQLREHLQSAP
jgi:uridine kinase